MGAKDSKHHDEYDEYERSFRDARPTGIIQLAGLHKKNAPVDATKGKNYRFYSGKISSAPDGTKIDVWHSDKWAKDYQKLEEHHGYIQWLFPVFENSGLNSDSQSLGKEEAKLIRSEIETSIRVVKSYKVMLRFYGMVLVDSRTGKIGRAEDFISRYRNIDRHPHNNLRISRIIVSLGELGFVRYKKPFVDHLSHEIKERGLLSGCYDSLARFWEPLLKETTQGYINKTLESPEDREESVLFKMLAEGSQQAIEIFDCFDRHEDPLQLLLSAKESTKEQSDTLTTAATSTTQTTTVEPTVAATADTTTTTTITETTTNLLLARLLTRLPSSTSADAPPQ